MKDFLLKHKNLLLIGLGIVGLLSIGCGNAQAQEEISGYWQTYTVTEEYAYAGTPAEASDFANEDFNANLSAAYTACINMDRPFLSCWDKQTTIEDRSLPGQPMFRATVTGTMKVWVWLMMPDMGTPPWPIPGLDGY